MRDISNKLYDDFFNMGLNVKPKRNKNLIKPFDLPSIRGMMTLITTIKQK